MELNLKNKRALVTGSTSGLGEAIARLLAAEGAKVIIHGRDQFRAARITDDIRAQGGMAEFVTGDLATDAGASQVADHALSSGAVDILVNNAGAYHHQSWTEATADDWMNTYQTNVLSGVRMIRRIVPQMREKGWGRIITIGGGLAIQPVTSQPDYNASLAARHNLAVSLARELKNSGITSNIVSPGAILVPSVKAMIMDLAAKSNWGSNWEEIERKAVQQLVPNDIGRLGRPEEIAGAVAYLCSPYADYISGAVLRVDGGTIRNVG